MKRFLFGLMLCVLSGEVDAATLISTASGNIDTTGTWSVVDTTGTNAFLNSEAANTALTTSPVASSTFTPAAETLTGIAVKLASVAAAPTGTLTVKLANSTSPGTRECTLTVNVADLLTSWIAPAAANADGGFVVLACAASPNGTDAYTINANTSVAAQVNLFSLLTTNWSRLLVTTGTKSGGPAAGDKFCAQGALTGAGTHNAFTVTVDTTTAINYGNVANSPVDPSICIGQWGTVTYATTASTNFVMQFAGSGVCYNGGTLNQGTTGAPIPASGKGTLTYNSTVEGDTGFSFRNGCTRNGVGSSGGRSVVKTKLTAPATATITSTLTTQDSTGWLAGDQIYIAGTVYTAGLLANYKGDAAALTSNAAGTSLPLTAAVANTHSADALSYTSTSTGRAYALNLFADVVLLNRNVVIQGSGATTNGYESYQPASKATLSWVEFSQISGTVAGKRGLEIDTGPLGSFSLTNFSHINSHNLTMTLAPANTNFGGTSSAYLTIQHGAFYNDNNDAGGPSGNWSVLSFLTETKNPFWKIDDITTLLSSTIYPGVAYTLVSVNGQFSNISASGSAANTMLQINIPYTGNNITGGGINNPFGPITSYTNISQVNSSVVQFGVGGTIAGYYRWRDSGLFLMGGYNLTIDPFYEISTQEGIYNSESGSHFFFRNGVIGWETGFGPAGEVVVQWDSHPVTAYFDNMELCPTGSVGGLSFEGCVIVFNLAADVAPTGGYVSPSGRIFLRNSSILAGPAYPTMAGQEGFYAPEGYITQDCLSCSITKHAAWVQGGFLNYDTTITHASGFSERMTPRINTVSGFIANTTLTLTSGAPPTTLGDLLASNGSGFIPGTQITGINSTTSYPVSQSQTVGSSGSPVQFQSYINYGSPIRMQSAPWMAGFKVAVASGASTAQACVWIRPSISTDAAPPWGGSAVTYNGDSPRMLVRANPYMGVQSDTVLTTASGLSAGSWSQVCATLPTAPADGEFEIVIDADQTFTSNAGGSINIAEWSCTICSSANNSQFWWNGASVNSVAPASSGGGHVIGG